MGIYHRLFFFLWKCGAVDFVFWSLKTYHLLRLLILLQVAPDSRFIINNYRGIIEPLEISVNAGKPVALVGLNANIFGGEFVIPNVFEAGDGWLMTLGMIIPVIIGLCIGVAIFPYILIPIALFLAQYIVQRRCLRITC